MKLAHTAWLALFSSSAVLATDVFINEIHYDNAGGDVSEGIEIAGPAGTDLSGMTLALYNGSSSQRNVYNTIDLAGVIPNQQDGFGTVAFMVAGIQNGAPDAIALVDNMGNVTQFLSYEGSFIAASGPAEGMTSTDIGVAETSSTPVGHSLQLVGTGSTYVDFTWQAPSESSFDAVNTDQIFGGGGPAVDSAPVVISTTPGDNTGAVAVDANIEISFSESVNVQGNWFSISCSVSGIHSAAVEGGPQHFTLDVDGEFVTNEVCDVTVVAALVNDLDLNDGPDFMESDFSFRFGTQVDSPVVINEVDADTAGSDTLEFIELYDGGVGNTPLDGLVVVLFNGSDDRSYNDAFDLDGYTTNEEGFFVLGNEAVSPAPSIIINNNALQNGADAVAIYAGHASDFTNDTPVTGISLVDALVYDTSDSDDAGLIDVLTPNQPQQNENGASNKDYHANARVPDGGAALDTSSYLQQSPTPGASNVATAEIFDIQSAGMTSPFEGQFVKSFGNIVTALDSNGFFMQTPTSRSDNNDETSDGIFVFTGSAPSVAVGDEVDVVGQIIEYFDFTEFSNGTQVTVKSNGNALPPVVQFDENTPSKLQPQPENELERFEGMIVTFEGIASAATDRFGDTAVVAGQTRAFREPGIAYPGIAGLPVWDGNPEIFEINPDGLLLENTSLFAGQTVSATGPLGFSFGDYQVWPTEMTIGEEPNLLAKLRDKEVGEMTVGSLNMYRPSQIANVYEERLSKISQFVRNVMNAPDILAVSEVESIDVLETIAAQINADDASINYSAYLEEGNDIGGIDVGFLVRQSVEMDAVVQYGKDTIFDYDNSLLNDRPPLLFKGRVVANGSDFPIHVLVVHNRSLSSVDTSDRVRNKRLAQADFVANIVQDIQSDNPSVNLVVTGDFNAYQFTDGYVDVLGHIAGTAVASDNLLWQPSPVTPVLTNQVNNLAATQQYSFVFGGSAQVLDHALTTANLSTLVTDFAYARGNSDAPAGLVNDDSNALRASDHDGLVMYVKMDSDNDTIADSLDMCPATSVPETAPSKGLKPNHFALMDGDIWFDTTGKVKESFSLVDTAGCSCEQIVEELGLGKGHLKHGCNTGIMNNWISAVAKP
ncbi:Ig-like domain-containing protein [Alteromonas facilis]|uniref:endonuclease/exonuclease/phosphatase family protein n=1 Tax=Alteromonas facilis TaxID=2048004 RepID=UPI000C294F19|nr:Ig-like domain-containing protein [Alteromonas facilis]